MMDDLARMALQAEALLVHDDRGRLLHTREPEPSPAPRFFMGRTRTGNLWRFRHNLPDALAMELDALASRVPVSDDLRVEAPELQAIRDCLARDGEIRSEWCGPAYYFPELLPSHPGAVLLTDAYVALLGEEFAWLRDEWRLYAPVAVTLVDGCVVSVCFCSRTTPQAAEAGVETLEAFRGRGHATRAVAAWADAVQDTGRAPLYSTSWENLASQGIARKLGLRLYGVDLSLG